MEIINMKCDDYIPHRFVNGYPSRGESMDELKNHIVNCKKCFEQLIEIAPMYNSIIAKEYEDENC